MIEQVEALAVGDVRDFANFTSAVIDERAFDKLSGAIEKARSSADAEIIAGGTYDRSEGWFVRPTLIVVGQPAAGHLHHRVLRADPRHLRLRGRQV